MSEDERDERNDGSILDDGYNKYGKAIFHYNTRFLNQSVIEKVWQAGFNASYRIPLGPGSVLLEGGYTFEYCEDKDLVKGRTDTTHYINVGLGYRF
jgi:aryl-phospho-beta-D-glucosidase BglC (GH1 family)